MVQRPSSPGLESTQLLYLTDCLCSAHFFIQKVGVMIPTLGTIVLEKDR